MRVNSKVDKICGKKTKGIREKNMKKQLKYVVIGAGGTGGAIGGFLAKAGKDVTLIARGDHLERMQDNGLGFETPDGNFSVPVKACTMEDYGETPDVIFVCVKGYSLDEAEDFIAREIVRLAEPYLGQAVHAYRYTLPWKRMFEVQISQK